MASDKAQFKEASGHWHDLRRQRRFSVAPDVGVTAIVVSTDISPSVPHREAEEQREAFLAEGRQLAARIEAQGQQVGIVRSTSHMLINLVKNPRFSSIYTIGHGTLGHVSTEEPLGAALDWKVLSEATDHLKTGVFVQHQCGNRPNVLNVPLGLFVVSQPRNVWAANGEILPDSMLTPEDEAKITPLLPDNKMPGYRRVKSLFPCDGSGLLLAQKPAETEPLVAPVIIPPF